MKTNKNLVEGVMVANVNNEGATEYEKKYAREMRAFGKGFAAEITSDLDAILASVNKHLDAEVTIKNTTMSCSQWLKTMGVDMTKCKHGLTSKVIKAVWNKNMKNGSDLCRWQKITATVGEKYVYEFVEEKNKKTGQVTRSHRTVGKYHLVRINKWTVDLLFQCLYDSWNWYGKYNEMQANEEYLAGVKHFYVNQSETATRLTATSKKVEVKMESIEW